VAGPVGAVAFSPDKRTFVTASHARTIRLWEVATRQPLGAPAWHRDELRAVAFSPDGKTVLTGCRDGTAWLWRVVAPQTSAMPTFDGAGVPQAFGPSGRSILTGGFGEAVQLWDTTTGKPLGPRIPCAGEIESAAISPDERMFLIGST